MKFTTIYENISRLNSADPASASNRLGKLMEEVGEFATEINKLSGRKIRKPEDTDEAIEKEILLEGADIIQNVISILDGFGFTAEDLLNALNNKNGLWDKVLKVKGVKKQVADKFEKDPMFTGCGITKEQGEVIIVVYWKEEVVDFELLPFQWDGVPVRHKVIGTIKQQ
jgi:NTP pyrophosphatase (non-canonical NTP hydrolase)